MTNPNNAIGTNGAYGGRTSVNAFNDNLAIYLGRGVLSGFVVSPDSGMSVVIGGDGTTRDVAIAEDNIGNKTTINNISESPVALTIAGAPASNSRIDAIVAYVDSPAQGSATETDNPSSCGLIAVQGTVAATPSQPDENAIRTAITADGASGTTAYYVVLGYITVENGTTDITSEMIAQGAEVLINGSKLADVSVLGSKIADGTITQSKLTASLVRSFAYLPGDTVNISLGLGFARGSNSKDTFNCTLPVTKSLALVNGGTMTWPSYSFQIYDFQNNESRWVQPNGGSTTITVRDDGIKFQGTTVSELGVGNYDFGLVSLSQPVITFS